MIDLVNRKIPQLDIPEIEKNPKILEIQLKIQDLNHSEGNHEVEIQVLKSELKELVSKEPKNEYLEKLKLALDDFEDNDYWKEKK